jgi:hypothetical protein
MRLAYLTTEEVNQALAPEMAHRCGVTVHPLWPKDPPPDGEYDAVLYDWDSWPAARRQQLLAGLVNAPPHRPVAVHGYHLTDGQAEALRSHGVAVHRSLRPEVFRLLRQAVFSAHAADPAVGRQETLHDARASDAWLKHGSSTVQR